MTPTLEKWDRNKNDSLDEHEFRTGWERTGWFQIWDTDTDNVLEKKQEKK